MSSNREPLAPPVALVDVLAAASRRSGRAIAEVWNATYVSPVQLRAALAEDPTRAQEVARWEPHWRIQFAKREWMEEHGGRPWHMCRWEPADDVLVFADGAAMTQAEMQPVLEPEDANGASQRLSSADVTWTYVRNMGREPTLPSMALVDALALASRRSGRAMSHAWNATYRSALELEAALAEDPTAAPKVARWEPHWWIQFAIDESIQDLGHGPAYVLTLDDSDDVLVFGDASTMTFGEQQT